MKCLLAILLGFCASIVAASAQQIVPLNTENTGASVNSSGADNNWSLVSYYDWYNLSGGGTTPYTTSPANYAYVATTYPAPTYWTPDTTSPIAKWIAPNPNQGTGAVNNGNAPAPGIYTYQLTFTSSVARTVQISGEVAADNQIGIVYNGVVEVAGPSATPTAGVYSTNPANSNYLFSKTNSTSTNPTSQYGGQYGSNAPLVFNFNVAANVGTNTIDFLVNNVVVYNSSGQLYSPDDNATGLFVTDFEVQAVPEPSTWAIVVAGLGLLAFARFRASRFAESGTANRQN
jgi:hypothetical protein